MIGQRRQGTVKKEKVWSQLVQQSALQFLSCRKNSKVHIAKGRLPCPSHHKWRLQIKRAMSPALVWWEKSKRSHKTLLCQRTIMHRYLKWKEKKGPTTDTSHPLPLRNKTMCDVRKCRNLSSKNNLQKHHMSEMDLETTENRSNFGGQRFYKRESCQKDLLKDINLHVRPRLLAMFVFNLSTQDAKRQTILFNIR